MVRNKEDKEPENNMSFFDYFFEVIGWLQIAASPLLFGLIIGTLIYFSNPGSFRLVIAIVVAIIGLVTGIIFATRVWKKVGTMHFVSRVMATPELDDLEDAKKKTGPFE